MLYVLGDGCLVGNLDKDDNIHVVALTYNIQLQYTMCVINAGELLLKNPSALELKQLFLFQSKTGTEKYKKK